MAFRLADVKKTVRSRSDGQRYIHPKLLEGPSVSAQVGLALAYLHARLGRPRREVDPEMLVRFFGDPKVARGLVSCLRHTYRWRAQELADVLEAKDLARLAARDIRTPPDLRLFLYDALNARGHGFLPAERDEHLRPLARRLGLTPPKLDQLVALDAEENAVLVRVGPVPEPEHVVALYNYHAVDAILRNSAYVELARVDRAQRDELDATCLTHGIVPTWEGRDARLHNQPDAFGSYARAGLRLARALYAACTTAPALLASGRAQVPLPGKTAFYVFDSETLRALTGGTGIIRRAAPWPDLREAWDRHRAAAGTAGWRLVGAPEPVLSPAGLALAPFACRRDETQVLLWPVRTEDPAGGANVDDVLALRASGLDVLPILWEDAGAARDGLPCVRSADGVAGIVAALEAHWSGRRVRAGAQALDGLLAELDARGFIPEAQVADALGCATIEELPRRLRALDERRATYVPGLGLCSRAFADEMRKGLRRKRRGRAA